MPPPQLQVTMFDTFCTSIKQFYIYYADFYVLRRFTQICKHYADFVSLRRFASITQNFKDNAVLTTLRSAGSLQPTSASSRPAHHRSRWLWRRRRRGHSSGCHTRPIVVVKPTVTVDLRIYST